MMERDTYKKKERDGNRKRGMERDVHIKTDREMKRDAQ